MDSFYEKIHDPVVKHGRIQKDQTGTLRYGGANLYVTLYRVDDWMIRCFCRNDTQEPPSDILTRYQHISNFCQQHGVTTPTLVPIIYVDNAIEVDFFDRSGTTYTLLKTAVLPFVRMQFITGLALGSFIKVNYQRQALMQELCAAWLRMVHDLKRIRMAHGDLDLTNVLVTQEPSGLVLKLIDYDNAWVPALQTHYQQTEVGHEHFQHPAFQSRTTRPYDEHMDNFSMLTMYISLKMLALYPNLYTQKEWGPDDTHHLLLTSADYQAEMNRQSNNITRLRSFHVKELEPLLQELSLSLQAKRQPRNLIELLPEHTKRHSGITETPIVPEKETDLQPGSTIDEFEVVYDKWNEAVPNAQKDIVAKPPDLPQPLPSSPWAPTQPATGSLQAQTQAQVPFVVNNAPQPPQKQKRSKAWVITLVIILVILLAILLIAYISAQSNPTSQSSGSLWSIHAMLSLHFSSHPQPIAEAAFARATS
jgi:hypothetical protein